MINNINIRQLIFGVGFFFYIVSMIMTVVKMDKIAEYLGIVVYMLLITGILYEVFVLFFLKKQ
jgi:hypothetical protein